VSTDGEFGLELDDGPDGSSQEKGAMSFVQMVTRATAWRNKGTTAGGTMLFFLNGFFFFFAKE